MDIYTATAEVIKLRTVFDTVLLSEDHEQIGADKPPVFSNHPIDIYLQYLEITAKDIGQAVGQIKKKEYHFPSLSLLSFIATLHIKTNLDTERARLMNHLDELGLVAADEWTEELANSEGLEGIRADVIEGMHISMAIEMATMEFGAGKYETDEERGEALEKHWLSIGTSLISLYNSLDTIRNTVVELEGSEKKVRVAGGEADSNEGSFATGANFDPQRLMETIQGFSEEELKHFDVEPIEGESPIDTMSRAIDALPEAMVEVINRGQKDETQQEKNSGISNQRDDQGEESKPYTG